MDISFILAIDELYTLMSLIPNHTEAGKRFAEGALPGAEMCDLSGLVDKGLARRAGAELEVAPVIRMVADALARAAEATSDGGVWMIESPWVALRCEAYPYQDGCFRVTPLKG